MSWKLVATAGPLVGQSFLLNVETTVGRVDGNVIVLPETNVSRQHARFFLTPDGPVVEDLGSTNGTVVNGTRIAGGVRLAHGTVVQIGGSTFQVDSGAPVAKPQEVSREAALAATTRPGCLLPDLSGVGRGLDGLIQSGMPSLFRLGMLMVMVIIGFAFLRLLIALGAGLVAAAGDAFHPNSSAPAPATAPATPPPSPTEPPKKPPVAEKPAGEDNGIEVIEAKVTKAERKQGFISINPHVLVWRWKNHTGHPVSQIIANIQTYDAKGGFSITIPLAMVYSGPPVPEGAEASTTKETGPMLSIAETKDNPPVKAVLEDIEAK